MSKSLSSIRKEDELKRLLEKREKLIDKIEGNRPPVNDPRLKSEIKTEMTQDEYDRQTAGSKIAFKRFLEEGRG